MSLHFVEALAVLAMSAFLVYQARRLRRVLPRSPRPVAYGLAAAGGSGFLWKGAYLLQVRIPGAQQASEGGEATTAVITTVVILLLLYGCYRMAKGKAPEPPQKSGKEKRP